MTLQLELEKAEHWIIRDSQVLFTAPFPEYSSIVSFSSNIIGVIVEVAEAPDTWKFGGWMWQKVSLPFGGANVSSSALNHRKLFLRRKQLFIFPLHLSSYQLAAQFPSWLPNVSVKIWEYVGPQINPVETKLDILLQKHSP